MSYKKPILTEIYVDMTLADKTITTENMFDIVLLLREEGFPEIELLQATDPILPQPSKPDELVIQSVPRIRCWNSERSKLVQISPRRLILNKVKEYLGWRDFRKFFLDVVSVVEKRLVELAPKSISLTTIDSLEVQSLNYSFGQYFNCTSGRLIPTSYADAKEAMDIILGKGSLNTDLFNRQLKISARPQGKMVTIRVESVFHDLIGDKKVEGVLEALHIESTQTFESLITDVTRQQVMGGMK